MSDIRIVRNISEDYAAYVIGLSGEYSPLRAVAAHVAKKQIERALTLSDSGSPREAIFEAEKELVRLYVGEDFCGLCGRYTDHRGEH